MKKLRVGVLMAGRSIEREVSFNSGRTVCDHLDRSLYEVIPIFQTILGKLYLLPWHFLHRGKISDFEDRLQDEARSIVWDELSELIDFAFIAMHGRYGEDGTLQGMLELLNIPYLGSKVFASALCMDKVAQRVFLQQAGIAVPRAVIISSALIEQGLSENLLVALMHKNGISFPCVVKPQAEGSSFGISIVHNQSDLISAICKACFVSQGIQQSVLIEEKIEGMEFSIIVLTDEKTGKPMPLVPTEIVLEDGKELYDYDQKYMPGRAIKYTPARCNKVLIEEIQKIAIQIVELFDIKTIARIDGFVTEDNRIVITDPNSSSGLAPSSFFFCQAAQYNMTHAQVINHLIKTELIQYRILPMTLDYSYSFATTRKKMRIAVLMGGDSHEREISLESGRNVVYKLSSLHYEIVPLFVTDTMQLFSLDARQLVLNSTKEIMHTLINQTPIGWSTLQELADFVFIGLHGGRGENGTVQAGLEMLGMPYNGSSILTSALCMDKFKTAQFLRSFGFSVPYNRLVTVCEWKQSLELIINQILRAFKFPIVIKPHDDGCSVMVYKVDDEYTLKEAIEQIFNAGKYSVLVEEFLQGMELTVGVIGNQYPQVLPPTAVRRSAAILSMEEKFLPGAGENLTPAPLSPSVITWIQEIIRSVYQTLNAHGYVRADCFYQTAEQSPTHSERLVILEVNTLPALTPATCFFHQAAEVGLQPVDIIEKIIMFGLELYQRRSAAVSSVYRQDDHRREQLY